MNNKLDVEAVITSYNQGDMILEAVMSLCNQTVLPKKIFIVDDGSTDQYSLEVLNTIEKDLKLPVPIQVLHQHNKGVSAARNAGICLTQSSLVLILDGDDKLETSYIEEVGTLLINHPRMVAASSWMKTFGVLEATVCPSGGNIVPFLSHNCCPATHIFKKKYFKQTKGYDESMQSGYEDWEFFITLLESTPDALIGIVEKALINYRTNPTSANIKSMDKRLSLMRYIIEKHKSTYKNHVLEVILDLESISTSRLLGWENEIVQSIEKNQDNDFIKHPSYGDGGMAAAVRIASILKQ